MTSASNDPQPPDGPASDAPPRRDLPRDSASHPLFRDPASVRSPAPVVGQHGRSALAEVGYTNAELDALEAAGALFSDGFSDGSR